MHSSFPWKDERRVYRPVARNSIRHWLIRIARICQAKLRLLVTVIILILLLTLFYWGWPGQHVSHHTPVVLVTVLEQKNASAEGARITDKVLENRRGYAEAHGYEMAVFNSTDYPIYSESERVWVKLAALRDAMNQYPKSEWFWYLDQNAIIMNPSIPVHTHFLSQASLLGLPLRDVPVFPDNTAVRTPSLRAQPISQISLILSHGAGILHTGSILLRRGDYTNFVIDSWNDPLVRSYGFPGEDREALEHLILWHSTILEGLAIMPKRSILSFGVAAGDDEQYHEGDFVVHLDGCEDKERNCEKEFLRFWAQRGSLTVENEHTPPQLNS